MKNNLTLLFGGLLFVMCFCGTKNNCNNLKIRQIYLDPLSDTLNHKIFILDYPEKELSKGMEALLDSFICSRITTTACMDSSFIIWVIKEDNNLKENISEELVGITDSYNPYSTVHYVYRWYNWQDKKFLYKEDGNHNIISFDIPCYNSVVDSITKVRY